jgi:hypothetical protein
LPPDIARLLASGFFLTLFLFGIMVVDQRYVGRGR